MRKNPWLVRPIVMAVGSCFSVAPAWSNPTGPQVMHGNVQIQGLDTNNLKVTNSPSSIIHWQGFSIGAGQATQFVQQSASSAVLNRVVGADISQIHGQLLSNGRVFLINPAGILIGAGGVVDTAGFVGSTLNMLNADFLAGKLKFDGDAAAGSIVNQGWIRAGYGGNIVLVAPTIENSGLIHAPGGQLVLAAGQKMTIGSLELDGVQFEIQAPTDSVLNVGKLLADGGAVGVFAGTLKHTGDIRANALVRDEAGRIVLKAQGDVTTVAGSTISANGKTGGDILVHSGTGHTRIAGQVTAEGSAGRGGEITLLGDRVSLTGHAHVDASGSGAGGQIRIGGDYQGANPDIANASHTFIGPNALLRADSRNAGDGGRIIVWADKATQYYGGLSARGGTTGGNGGFAEVSGKENLIFAGTADLGAPKGRFGELLLDPLDLFIANFGGSDTSIIDEASDVPLNAVTISPAALAAIPGNVTLRAGRYMLFKDPVNLTRSGQSLTAVVDTWTPTDPAGVFDNLLYIGADITTNGGAVSFTAPRIQTGGGVTRTVITNGGAIALNTTRGAISGPLDLNAGTGAVTAFAPKLPIPDTDPQQFDLFPVQLGNVIGGSLNISIAGAISTNDITTTGPVSLTSAERTISTGNVSSGPGNIAFNAMDFIGTNDITTAGGGVFLNSTTGGVFTGNVTAGGGNVALMSREGVSTNIIDTTGNVNLLATQGDIFATVNNAASLTASATRTDGNSVQTTINQTAATPLNANSITANASGCFNAFHNCAGATIVVTAIGPVNVGTITATAPVTGNNNTSASIGITSMQSSIRAMSASSKVTGSDVSLQTSPLTGGGIGTAALPLPVDVRRTFSIAPNGEFDIAFSGALPNGINANVGVAPMGLAFSGALRQGGNVLLTANASDTTVTLNSLPTTGFNQRVFNSDPFITFNVPNGNLSVPAITVPEGDTMPSSETYSTANLDVMLSARNNINLGSYTRASTAASLPKATSVTSEIGSINIGTFNGSKDQVSISGSAGVTISATSLTTEGSVSVSSQPGPLNIGKITSGGGVALSSTSGNITVTEVNTTSGEGGVSISSTSGNINIVQIDSPGGVSATTGTGNITVADIDTTTGMGGVALRISCVDNNSCGMNPAIVGAAADNVAFEVRSGGPVTVTGHTIGTQGPAGMRFQNPLDIKGTAVTLTSRNAGGRIGFASDTAADNIPIVAEAPDLALIAGTTTGSGTMTAGAGGSFNVRTGTANLQRLSVTANPSGLAVGQASAVRTNANDYFFNTTAGNVVFSLPGASVGGMEFTATDARFSVDTHQGGIEVGSNANVNNAAFSLNARGGSITGQNVTGRGLTFSAGTANDPGRGANVAVVTGTINVTEDVSITAGRNQSNNFSGDTPRAGRVQTGPIQALRDVTITAFGEHPAGAGPAPAAIRIDNAGAPGDISASGTPARTVVLNAVFGNSNTSFSATGRIEVRDIFARNITTTSLNNSYTVGNLSATGTASSSIQLHSRQAITTGTLDAPVIHIRQQQNFNGSTGAISTGNIGTTIAGRPSTLNLRGTSVTIGSVMLDTSVADTIDIHGSGAAGQVTIGASGINDVLVGGAGSTINITSMGTSPFTFSRINAGDTGTVSINSGRGIRQTTNDPSPAADGITARTITLTAATPDATDPARPIDNSVDASGLDLRNSTEKINLTISSGGPVALNANTAALANLNIIRNAPTAMGIGPQPFSLANLGTGPTAQIVTIDTAPSNLMLTVDSPTPLNFSLTHNNGNSRGITLAGVGIRTGGGNLTLSTNNGPIDASTGGITTGGPDGGGNVTLSSSGANAGPIITGAINTKAAGMGNSGFIDASTNCAGCGIAVNGALDTGLTADTAAFIRLRALNSGSITGMGTILSGSTNSVTLLTNNGNIGALGAPLAITTPTANLDARGAGPSGLVFASLAGTNDLTLRADNGFNVSSSVAFNRLILSTRGSGTGTPGASTLNLTAPAQTYAFARADTAPPDPPDQFQVITASRATPTDGLTTASFTAVDGDLLVATGALINPTSVTLASSARDVLITGAVALDTTSQTFSAQRNITVQAQGGSMLFNAATQNFSTQNGNIAFLGGAGADERVTVSASSSQSLSTNFFSGGGLNLVAGSGDRSSVSLLFTGTGAQTVAVRGAISITGGDAPSTDSFAEIRASSGAASGAQSIRNSNNITLTAGQGTNADARIVNTSASPQQVGESNFNFDFQTQNITLRGGKAESGAEITSAGRQRIRVNGGTLTLRGGDGVNSGAKIESTSAITQEIGSNPRIGAIDMEGGSGVGSSVQILASGSQTVLVNNSTRLAGGAGAGAHALMRSSAATSQNVTAGNLTLLGGSGPDAYARITAPGTQRLNFFNAALTGGTASGTFALVDTGASQTLNGGDITLTAAGLPPAGVPAGNAGAAFRGQSQTVNAGFVMINGGTGLGGSPSDAIFENLAGDQTFNVNQIAINGGLQHSRTGIFNLAGAGAQFISTPLAISLTGVGSGPGAGVLIDNVAATAQTISVSGGSVILDNVGTGVVGISSAGTQTMAASSIEVLTSAASTGSSRIYSAGNQYIRTTDAAGAPRVASLRAAALGSGSASIDTDAMQLLEVGYFEHAATTANPAGSVLIGGANGMGTSRIQAPNQSIFARTITLQGPASGMSSKLTGLNTQAISVLDGVTDVLGGSGASSVAAIDSITQAIVSNGAVTVRGGSADNASASIVSTGTQIVIATRDDVTVQGGTSPNATARIETRGTQIARAADEMKVTAGSAAGSTARIEAAGNQAVTSTNAMTVTGGGAGVIARIATLAAQIVNFGSLALRAELGSARIESTGDQTLSGGSMLLQGGGGADSIARITTQGTQTLSVTSLTLNGGAGANSFAQVHADGAQNITFNALTMNSGNAGGAFAKIDTASTQTLTGGNGDIKLAASPNAGASIEGHSQTLTCGAACGIMLQGSSGAAASAQILNLSGAQSIAAGNVTLNAGAGANARALITSPGAQTLNVGALILAGGGGTDALAQIHAGGAQSLTFTALTMNAGGGSGAFAKIDTPSTQTLTGASGDVSLTASPAAGASIEGHSQTLSCGAACDLMLVGNTGAAANAQMINLSGAQTINAGSILLRGGQSASSTAIRNQGTADQIVTASSGAIHLLAHPNAAGAAVLIENVPATGQTLTAAHDLSLTSEGSGTVAVTSGGTQSIDARGLDVVTLASAPGGAQAVVSAAAEQTLHTRGPLGAAPGVGMRVASLSTGIAKVESGGNQVIEVDGHQLLIGRLAFGPPGPGSSASGNPAAGDSLVLATSALSDPNQTVRAGSVYIQGPSGNLRISKLSGDGTQVVMATPGGISIIGGSGTDAFAIIDPTNQTIDTFGDILLQGGSGPNADALINATGPQTVTSQMGSITLIGGTGQGADALIATTSPFQTVSAPNGSVVLVQGAPTGGVAGLQQGSNLAASQIAVNSLTNEILREQDNLEQVRDDAISREGEDDARGRSSRVALCN